MDDSLVIGVDIRVASLVIYALSRNDTELMELRPDWTVAQAMDAIRKNGFDKETINNCYVTDRDRTLIGVLGNVNDVPSARVTST